MRILTYKRTHTGDPNVNGLFGINNYMGRVRNYDFDAVIGVGGIGHEPKTHKIDRKINWIGITPKRRILNGTTGSVVEFEYFLLLEEYGPLLSSLAPSLAKRMYDKNVRLLLRSYSTTEKKEAEIILKWSKNQKQPRSFAYQKESRKTGCKKKCWPNEGCFDLC